MAAAILGNDEISLILGFLQWDDILKSRVNKQMREAAKMTLVPYSKDDPEFFVWNTDYVTALEQIHAALPMLQCIHCQQSYQEHRKLIIQNGTNPHRIEGVFPSPFQPVPVSIEIVGHYRHLRHLSLQGVDLNGSYPFLFDFPQLRFLDLSWTGLLEWDLSMVSGLPKLETLLCVRNNCLRGNLNSLIVLKNTLTDLLLTMSQHVEGSLMTLADFPKLQNLNLVLTRVTGDIRHIGPNDFISIQFMSLSNFIYGGGDHFTSIEEVPDLMLARYNLKKQRPILFTNQRWYLSRDSQQYYEYQYDGPTNRHPPFQVEFVQAGARLGWRWTNGLLGGSCEIHWLDPEPTPTDEGYDEYLNELEDTNDVDFYRGFQRPPTFDEHQQRCAEVPLERMLLDITNRHR